MKIVVDANIIISAIFNINGTIGDLLFNSGSKFNFHAPGFLKQEVALKQQKMMKLSGMPLEKLIEVEELIYTYIQFVDEVDITSEHWQTAHNLANDIDPKDTVYVALTYATEGTLWSGDKKLIKGLRSKEFMSIKTTAELFQLRDQLTV